MIKAGIVGATGYAGAELVRILSGHSLVEISVLTSRKYAGKVFSEIFPSLSGIADLRCEEYDAKNFSKRIDVAFLALPHKLPMEFAPELIDQGKKVIDLSADYRFSNVDTYESFYQPHSSRELCGAAVYGLSEINFEKIKNAELIGNPGCYPTSALLPLIPLVKEGLVETDSIIVDSKSGASGAGRSLSLAAHFCEVNESFKAYKIASHRHTPEMEEKLGIVAGRQVAITFVPHLLPVTRGMMTTVYAGLTKGNNEDEVARCYDRYYSDKHFIRICKQGTMPDIAHVRGSNYCDIGFKVEEKTNRVIIVSAIDNLVKGAAGQAVQNMNLMYGLDEKAGLDAAPFPV